MHFLLDAHIPRRLCKQLREAGHECRHTEALAAGNRSSDDEISSVADLLDAVVVTKDDDFEHRPSFRCVAVKTRCAANNADRLGLTVKVQRTTR